PEAITSPDREATMTEAMARTTGQNPSSQPPPRDGEGEKDKFCSPSPLRGGGRGEGLSFSPFSASRGGVRQRGGNQRVYTMPGGGMQRWKGTAKPMNARLDGRRQPLISEIPCPRSGRRWRRACGRQDVPWRMPAHADPEAAGVNQDGTVQVQRGDRGPSGRRSAHNPVAFRRPAEVLDPTLPAWVKEADHLAGLGIESGHAIGLTVVAKGTGQ